MKTNIYLPLAFSLFSLSIVACGDKEEDTTDTGEVEDTDTEDTDTEETDTDETDTEDTGEEETGDTGEDTEEPLETAFPELLPDFIEAKAGALPAPLVEEDWIGNTTVALMMTLGLAPMIEVQEYVTAHGGTVSCPEVQGTFPTDGLPSEDVIVTGNGCTTPEGVTYNGSFVYGEDGVVYSDFSTSETHEVCTSVTESQTVNGGVAFSMSISGGGASLEAETLIFIDSEELEDEENCTTESPTFAIHAYTDVAFGENEEQTINGTGAVLIDAGDAHFAFDVETVDELIDESICQYEPASGTNTLTNGVDELVYTFDGETDCDEAPTQMLSINGGAAEEVEGVACSTAEPRGLLGLFGGLIGLVWLRRRK